MKLFEYFFLSKKKFQFSIALLKMSLGKWFKIKN
jgi:hypothetical protein